MRTYFSHINDMSHHELINEVHCSCEKREYALFYYTLGVQE